MAAVAGGGGAEAVADSKKLGGRKADRGNKATTDRSRSAFAAAFHVFVRYVLSLLLLTMMIDGHDDDDE